MRNLAESSRSQQGGGCVSLCFCRLTHGVFSSHNAWFDSSGGGGGVACVRACVRAACVRCVCVRAAAACARVRRPPPTLAVCVCLCAK